MTTREHLTDCLARAAPYNQSMSHFPSETAPADSVGYNDDNESNGYVITRSTHICGYPGCGKPFRFRQNLLAHQTQKHGRQPRSHPSLPDPNDGMYVITQSMHICGYPDCGKSFRFRQNLLAHQTMKHGRTPTRGGRQLMADDPTYFNSMLN